MALTPAASSHILLVDDCLDGLLVRRALLEDAGYSVKTAANGEEALKLFESMAFDVVVTDYRMPSMNGAELIERIRKLNPGARIILLSGFIDTLGLTEQSTGADATIVKAFNEPTHLMRAVKRLANRAPDRKPPGAHKRLSARARAGAS